MNGRLVLEVAGAKSLGPGAEQLTAIDIELVDAGDPIFGGLGVRRCPELVHSLSFWANGPETNQCLRLIAIYVESNYFVSGEYDAMESFRLGAFTENNVARTTQHFNCAGRITQVEGEAIIRIEMKSCDGLHRSCT